MYRYSLSVALFDLVPVLLTATALVLMARAVAARHSALAPMAWCGALLVPLGGACKAIWKLIVALGGTPIGWLENLLFILMAPGFILMAFSMFHALRAWQSGMAAQLASFPKNRLLLWLAAPLIAAPLAALALPDSRLWFFVLLAVTTLASASLIVQAIAAARWSRLDWTVSASFIYNLAGTFALSGLSRLPPGETAAWIQECVNFSAQAGLAYGFWQLSRRMQTHP